MQIKHNVDQFEENHIVSEMLKLGRACAYGACFTTF